MTSTQKGKGRDPDIFGADYLENGWSGDTVLLPMDHQQ